jgi:hypothetical protein
VIVKGLFTIIFRLFGQRVGRFGNDIIGAPAASVSSTQVGSSRLSDWQFRLRAKASGSHSASEDTPICKLSEVFVEICYTRFIFKKGTLISSKR